VDQVSGWVRVRVKVRVRNASFPSGMKLYTCKTFQKWMKIGLLFPSIFGSGTYLIAI